MSYPAISLATATVGRYRCPQKRLQTARQPPVYPNSSPRIIAPVTPSPPSAALTPSIPVHRWIRVKTRETAVANPGKMKPGDVAQKVQEHLAVRFTTNDHAKCWKYFGVRPPTASDDPMRCKVQYCHYDIPHKDYVYTDEWVKLLTETLSDPKKYKEILGKAPLSLLKSAV